MFSYCTLSISLYFKSLQNQLKYSVKFQRLVFKQIIERKSVQ